jgi:hypothetical protein
MPLPSLDLPRVTYTICASLFLMILPQTSRADCTCQLFPGEGFYPAFPK